MINEAGLVFLLLVCLACSSSGAGPVLPMARPAMAVKVIAGTYEVGGQVVTVTQSVGLPIDAPERIYVRGEEVTILDEKPSMYRGGTYLRQTLGTVDKGTRVPLAIVPDSVKVSSCREPSTLFVEDRDYYLDKSWGGISRIEGGAITQNAGVCVDYAVFRQRIDAVQISPDGKASVKKGVPAMVCPEIPPADPGCTLLAYVHIKFRAEAITGEDIYALPSKPVTWRDYVKTTGRESVSRTLDLLASNKPVTIVCWGDSVTQGGSASKPENRYVDLLRARLGSAYPGAQVTVINAGIGGSSTDSRRAGFDQEVLAHKPDLITVEFVNDIGYSSEKIAHNYAEFMRRAREQLPNVEFIIITPHFVRPDWAGNFDAAVEAMRKAAADNRAAVGDTSNVWANLRQVGIPYGTLLANEINHPNDLGHEFFAVTIMDLLKPVLK